MVGAAEACEALLDGALIRDLYDNGVPLPEGMLGPDALVPRAAGDPHLHAPDTGLFVS